jgi:HD-GYP domain-containing protein (c-di-GMP phosphodiesterase class II)
MSEESAKEELLKMAGKELDPELTKTFVKHILEGLKRREAL